MSSVHMPPPDTRLSSPNSYPCKSLLPHSHPDGSCVKKQRPLPYTLLDTLQSSIFFGGFGSLSRELEAMDKQMAMEALARSSKSNSFLTVHSEKQAAITGSTKWPLRRYKITVQELPDGIHDHAIHDNNALDRTEPLVASVTAVMPSSVMDWLLSVTRHGEAIMESQAAVQLIEDVAKQGNHNMADSPATTMDSTMVKVSSIHADPTITSASLQTRTDTDDNIAAAAATATVAMAAIPTFPRDTSDHSASSKSNHTEGLPGNETSTVTNKVKETQPTWNAHGSPRQQEDGDTRTWWQRRRDARLQRDSNSREEKNNTEQEHEGSHRTWPPRRRSMGPGETFTQTTITRPDGTIESKSTTLNRATGVTETHTRIQHPDGSVQESTQREGHSAISRPTLKGQEADVTLSSSDTPSQLPGIRERWAQRRQVRMERREELREERQRTKQERRQELREAEAKQRETTAAAYGFVHSSTTGDSDNDAGEKFAPTTDGEMDPYQNRTSSHPSHENLYRSAWHQRREARRQERERERREQRYNEEEQTLDEQSHESTASRTWPPRGYLRRMEREQEPRHNV
ncbi:MAG: hypothetical protein J3Q66DRAFT_343879 [Benniella sp.]|nr:MAG: hypothetical protein J3Q66DRAFT_343879 [Benniella sp.]